MPTARLTVESVAPAADAVAPQPMGTWFSRWAVAVYGYGVAASAAEPAAVARSVPDFTGTVLPWERRAA